MSTSFAGTIKPYFTAYFRAHMLNFNANFDLWDPKVVEAAWPAIYNQISGGSMPTPLTPPASYAGTWDNLPSTIPGRFSGLENRRRIVR